jgi:hypothetical protein
MRKLMIVLTLALSYFTVIGTMSADGPPTCSPTCPFSVR